MPPSTNPFLFVAGNSYGRLAQLVEHTPDKGEVAGSSPASPTITRYQTLIAEIVMECDADAGAFDKYLYFD